MTLVDERRNGHRVLTTTEVEHDTTAQSSSEVALLAAERDELHQLADIDGDPIFGTVRTDAERDADRRVEVRIRAAARIERKRAGLAAVRDSRRSRLRARWDDRAQRARDRRLDPARNLTSDYRRYLISVLSVFALIAGGVAFTASTVHDGLMGADGPWTGYLIEPLASVLLVVSMLAQMSARERAQYVSRWFLGFDAALASASLLLVAVPWGVRYGFDAGSITVHLLAPLLIVAGVVAYHLITALYGRILTASKTDPVLVEHLELVRGWIADGSLPAQGLSRSRIERALRNELGRISTQQAQRVARHVLGT